MIDLYNAIGGLGFPIVMSIYLVVKFEKTLKENTKAIQDLSHIIKNKRS